MTSSPTNRLPSALSRLLKTHDVPEDHVEDVVSSETPRSPWIVSLDRSRTGKPHPYAVVRQGGLTPYDTYQDALEAAGGAPVDPGTGTYYELVDATVKDREQPFRPPITFRGQVGNLLLLTVPKELLLQPGQVKGLHTACKTALARAVAAGTLAKETEVFTFLVPEGVRICKLVEHKQ